MPITAGSNRVIDSFEMVCLRNALKSMVALDLMDYLDFD